MATGAPDVLVASKAAPVLLDERMGAPTATVSTGSVVGDVAHHLDAVMVCTASTPLERTLARDGTDVAVRMPGSARSARLRFVSPDGPSFAEGYRTLTELLWHGMHEIWDRTTVPSYDETTDAALSSFDLLNQEIAATLLQEGTAAGTGFLVHDYQLLLTPRLLRAARPDARVLYFHHIAWPGPDGFAAMPADLCDRVLSGVLAADTVAFFADRWRENFLATVRRLVPAADVDLRANRVSCGGHVTDVVVEPLSCSAAALAESGRMWPRSWADWAGDAPLVVHSGRTDPIKNAPRLVRAVRRGLAGGAHRGLRLLVRLNAHRLDIAANAAYLQDTTAEIEALNTAAGEEVGRVALGNDRAFTFGALARADVVVVNSLVDGQNLTAFEAAVVSDRAAPLVLSQSCGAAELLRDSAFLVNPYDLRELGQALDAALSAGPAERAARAVRAREVATRYDLDGWTARQLSRLGAAHG